MKKKKNSERKERRTLLLTPWYLPLRTIPWTDAVTLLYKGRGDVLASYDEAVSSPSVTWQMPAVVKLRGLPNWKNACKFSRENVYTRDNFRCQYCRDIFEYEDLTYDHVVPKSHGGHRGWTNIVTSCKPCNNRKGNKTCDEAGMWPMKDPEAPSWLPTSGRKPISAKKAPPEWQDYLGGWAT